MSDIDSVEGRISSMLFQVTEEICRTFVVSREQASELAHELLEAMESHGGDCRGCGHAFIQKHLGERLPWRSESSKEAWKKRRTDSIAGYTRYLESKKGWLDRK